MLLNSRSAILGTLCETRRNYFDQLRVSAATLVLVSHSVTIAGTPADSCFYTLAQLGYYSVGVFFCLSGFLICRSWLRARSLLGFVAARCLRIYPALWVSLILSVFVLGPCVTRLSSAEYFADRRLWVFAAWNATLLKSRFELPGVFETNPLPRVVNGSLWTLPFEVYCYIAIATCGLIGWLRREAFCVFVSISMQVVFLLKTTSVLAVDSESLGRAIDVGSQFATGAMLYVVRDRIVLRWDVFLLLTIACLAATGLPGDYRQVVWHLSLPYLLFCVGLSLPKERPAEPLAVDLSYGVYVYAFPVQQLAVWLFASMSWWQNILFSLPVTICFAYVSWECIERPSLALSARFRLYLDGRCGGPDRGA